MCDICGLQGTYLPARVGLELEKMQRHQILQDLGKQVKDMYERLHLQHDLLRSQYQEFSEKFPPESPALTSHISRRLESICSWKYAPPPLRSLRSRAVGESPLTCQQHSLMLELSL